MSHRLSFRSEKKLDDASKNALANAGSSSKKTILGIPIRSSYVGNSLNVASPNPRHSSIAGEGVGVTNLNPPQKGELNPSDPSTWTSRHSQSFSSSSATRPHLTPDAKTVDKSVGDAAPGGKSKPSEISPNDSTAQAEVKQVPPVIAVNEDPTPQIPIVVQDADVPNTVIQPKTIPAQAQSPQALAVRDTKEDADRRFSNQTSSFSTVDSDRIQAIPGGDEDALQESSDEGQWSSDQETGSPVSERGRTRKSDRVQDPSSPESARSIESITPDIKVDEVEEHKPQQPEHPGKFHETQGKVTPRSNFRAPSPAALSARGDDDAELERAKAMELRVSPLDESVKDRTVKMIIRGDWNSFQAYEEEDQASRHEPRLYLLGSDLSSEATYALEWTIGTLLKDGDTILIINAVEDEHAAKTTEFEEPSQEIKLESAKAAEEANLTMNTLTRQTTNQKSDDGYEEQRKKRLAAVADQTRSSSRASTRGNPKQYADRVKAVDKLETDFLRYVRKTTLQVRCMIEIIHCRSPRHLILNAIDELEPTLVVVGTRGMGVVKNVVMGSFSNYLVTKSSIPVMVARKRLKKPHHAKISSQQIKMTNNLTPFGATSKRKGLTGARID